MGTIGVVWGLAGAYYGYMATPWYRMFSNPILFVAASYYKFDKMTNRIWMHTCMKDQVDDISCFPCLAMLPLDRVDTVVWLFVWPVDVVRRMMVRPMMVRPMMVRPLFALLKCNWSFKLFSVF